MNLLTPETCIVMRAYNTLVINTNLFRIYRSVNNFRLLYSHCVHWLVFLLSGRFVTLFLFFTSPFILSCFIVCYCSFKVINMSLFLLVNFTRQNVKNWNLDCDTSSWKETQNWVWHFITKTYISLVFCAWMRCFEKLHFNCNTSETRSFKLGVFV